MNFVTFSCAVIANQQGKLTTVRTQIKSYEHSPVGAGGGGSKRTWVQTRQSNQVESTLS